MPSRLLKCKDLALTDRLFQPLTDIVWTFCPFSFLNKTGIFMMVLNERFTLGFNESDQSLRWRLSQLSRRIIYVSIIRNPWIYTT